MFYLHKGVRLSTPIKFQLNSEINDHSSDFILGYESEVILFVFVAKVYENKKNVKFLGRLKNKEVEHFL
jgi:hypothetical protein